MYQILTASAQMPSSCKGIYKRIAVVETESAERPKMISPRAKGVIRVVQTWEKLHVGTTDRCEFARAMREAETLLALLQIDFGREDFTACVMPLWSGRYRKQHPAWACVESM